MSVKPSLRGHAPHGCHPTTAAHRSRRMQEQIKIPGMPPSFFPFYTTNLFNHHIRSIPQPHSYQHTLTNTHTPTHKQISINMQFTTIVASALAVACAAASAVEVRHTAPMYPVSNGTATTGAAAPSGTGSAPGASATFEGGATQIFGSSAAMGLVLVGGIALVS